MFKSVKRFYEHKRSYDYGEYGDKILMKRRAHRRLRNQLRKILNSQSNISYDSEFGVPLK